MSVPASRQASRIVAPAGASTAAPSMVSDHRPPHRAQRDDGGRRRHSKPDGLGIHQRCSTRTRPSFSADRSPSRPSGRGRKSTHPSSPPRARHARQPRWTPAHWRRAPACASSNSPCRTVPTRQGTHWPHDSLAEERGHARQRVTDVGGRRRTPSPRQTPAWSRARAASKVSGSRQLRGPDEQPGRAAEQYGLHSPPPARRPRGRSGPPGSMPNGAS